jgi:ATP-binding cassette subfamily F protein 3
LASDSGTRGTRPSECAPQVDRKGQKRIEAEQRQARSRKKQEIQKRIAALEKEIAGLEAKEKELAAELEKPESYAGGRAMQINRELMHVHERLPLATAEWEAAGAEMAGFEAEASAM